ncbi:MAG TPA: hypothetical protein VOA41_11365 [Candidatus Dormibacteraeota bacterium]|nr:hypothetical protein [Candidatus Dormibacteraeota bacterium]
MNHTPKPGDFPIGSVESRAAMRALILHRKDSEPKRVMHVVIERIGSPERNQEFFIPMRDDDT